VSFQGVKAASARSLVVANCKMTSRRGQSHWLVNCLA
jgi:hypothetical protein